MSIRVRVLKAELRYQGGLKVHTAASGPVKAIHECYLHVTRDGETLALGEVRSNIAFVSGIAPDALEREIVEQVAALEWSAGFAQLLEDLPHLASRASAPVRALLDLTLHDGVAREAGVSVGELLGAAFQPRVPTNQCLFWSDDETFERRARSYLDRGFCDLKLRIGIGAFADDIARIDTLRALGGDRVSIAVDANGAWSAHDARERIAALADRGVVYIEQPVAPGDWHGLRALAAGSSVPLMVDEGLRSHDDVAQLVALEGAVWAHLKLVKLGGFKSTLAAASTLQRAGVTVQIGQMNEGAAATAAAVHAAMVVRSAHGELYGADGIIDDPCAGISYAAGDVCVPRGPGIGLDIDSSKTRALWEGRF